jgi:hypothetical protein
MHIEHQVKLVNGSWSSLRCCAIHDWCQIDTCLLMQGRVETQCILQAANFFKVGALRVHLTNSKTEPAFWLKAIR